MKKFVALLAALSLLISLAACGQAPAADKTVPSANDDTQQTADTSTQEPQQEPEPQKLIGLPGSHITDIRMGLNENFGIPEGSIGHSKDPDHTDVMISDSSVEPEDAGIMLMYSLSADSDYQLLAGMFDILNTGAHDDDTFLTAASVYLGFCATVPYDTADAEKAKAFITDNIADFENGPSETIGDAIFTIRGNRLDDGAIGTLGLTIKVSTYDEQYSAS